MTKRRKSDDTKMDEFDAMRTDDRVDPMDQRFWGVHLVDENPTARTRRYLGRWLHSAIAGSNDRIASAILASKNFNLEVIKNYAKWSALDEEARLKVLAEERDSAKKFEERVRSGINKRSDQVDKVRFHEWVVSCNIEPDNMPELVALISEHQVGIHDYGNKVLREWYREVKPQVIFRSGRPKTT